jgi:CBS domain-containing protein
MPQLAGHLQVRAAARFAQEAAMEKRAREVMTPNPACCTPTTTLDLVAKMMIQTDCGEIPVLDVNDRVIGVVTDRDIVCRVVAEGKNPMAYTAETCMTHPVVTVSENTPVDQVVATMEKHQIRRVPVVDDQGGACTGIISQADIAWKRPKDQVGELVREVSRDANAARNE